MLLFITLEIQMAKFSQVIKKLPYLGVGLGLRRQLFEDTIKHRKDIDWLEIAPENFICRGGPAFQRLIEAKKYFKIVPHGINLSIGGTAPFDPILIKGCKKLFSIINPPWFSDHICFNYVDGTYIHDLIPLPFNRTTVNLVADRVKKIQDIFQIPFLLENPSYYMILEEELDEASFITEILEKADCGLLLDINNVYVNSRNHNYNPISFLKKIPIERTVQVHIAGHYDKEKILIDTHGAAIVPDVYSLLGEMFKLCKPKAILLERDFNFPNFTALLNEIEKIRSIEKSNLSKKKKVKELVPV